MKIKNINIFIFYLLSLLYLESIFRILLYDSFFRLSLINLILFIIAFAFFLFIWTKAFPKKANKIAFFVILFILCLWFAAQFVVKDFMDFYISFSILKIADQVGDFMGKAFIEIGKRIIPILLMFIPFIIALCFRKKIDFKQNNLSKSLLAIILMELSFLSYMGSLNIDKNNSYSPYELFARVNKPSLNIEKVGVVNTFCLDLHRLLWGFKPTIYDETKLVTYHDKENTNYNNLDIDFDKLLESTQDKDIQKITKYFKESIGTPKNEYTGFFEGKNLILFMAESFNEIAVRKDTTPTLYKLTHSGFVFDNYYTPTIYSTIGGEFQELTGLYADFYNLSKFRSGDNTFPLGLANLFREKGYNTFAYHNNDYDFQNRNTYLETLGFTNYKACGNGLEINCDLWPQSDVEMINATYEDYIDSSQPFMVFYASVSGHAGYNFIENDMAKKNKEKIDKLNLPYSEPVKAYLAAQMELDKALELLINKLDEEGVLDNTVIALTGDHYPYELSVDEINEAASYKKDPIIEINHSKFILWNNKMDTIKIDKVGSQIDVLPTIYNVFNIPYDSRLIIGNDILSNEPGLAMFENSSWVSDKGSYLTTTGVFTPKEKVNDKYIKDMNKVVNNRIVMSKYIMEKDYYRLVYDYIK